MYLLVLTVLLALLAEAGMRMRELRWGIAGIVYLTIGLWYFLDPVYRPEGYEEFTQGELATVYVQVLTFLIGFRLLTEVAVLRTPSAILRAFDPRELDRSSIVVSLLLVWFVLFLIGMYRAEFRFVDALFPLGGRWSGAQMWNRNRMGGATDFVVSLGYYTYQLCCAAFGIIAVGTRRNNVRVLMLFMMGLTWPMFALSGSRNTLLTVVIPAVLAVLIMARWRLFQRLLFLAACAVVLNFIMLVAIAYRERGVGAYFKDDDSAETLSEAKHQGLNMPEELIYINRYQSDGRLEPEMGYEYFAQAVNFVPRFIWPGKPFPGEKFAALRVGYFQGAVAATVSNGLIGQGVQNFGPLAGPLAPALILALLARWMCLMPRHGAPFLRASLVIFLMAIIPNLGRDITLLNLWPAIFGVAGAMFWERTASGRQMIARHRERQKRLSSPFPQKMIPPLRPPEYR
jgi:oligosaccharide repeat unit polymerase